MVKISMIETTTIKTKYSNFKYLKIDAKIIKDKLN